MMNMKTNKRYWIHISSNENRNSILRNGLIPQSILNSKQFSKESRIIFNEYNNNKKCIYLIPFKDEIDFYDIENIKNYVFPLPLIANGFSYSEIEDLIEDIKIKMKYAERFKNVHNLKYGMEEYDIINNELQNRLNTVFKREGREFDVWIIDTEIQNINPIEDEGGYNEDTLESAYYVTKKISPKALTLIKGNIKYRKDFKLENKNNILSFNIWKIIN